jgi:4-amino-4-deoxy-L-arabinose transferase-like glycosyltransferase
LRPPQVRIGRREAALLAGGLLLAGVLRLGWPTLTEFKFSEARMVALVRQVLHGPSLPLVGVPASVGFDHSPLSMYLYLPPFVVRDSLLLATLYGGLAGVAGVALTWWLGRRWFGARAAAVAGVLLAASPWAVLFSRKIWQIVFVVPLVVIFVGLAAAALVARRRGALAGALVCYALLVQVHPSAVSLLPALLLWGVVGWRRLRWGEVLLGGLLGALTAAPFLVHQVRTGWPVLEAARALRPPVWDVTAVRQAWEVVTGRSLYTLAGPEAVSKVGAPLWLSPVFGVLGWLTLVAGLGLAWEVVQGWRDPDVERQRQAQFGAMLLTWLVVPVLFNLRHSVELYLHSWALLLPAAFLVVGWGVDRLLRWGRSRVWAALGWAALLALVGAQVVTLGQMARVVASHPTPGGFGVPLGRYLELADRVGRLAAEQGAEEVLVVGQGDSPETQDIPAIFDALLSGRVGFRLVDGYQAALFPAHPALALVLPEAGRMAALYAANGAHLEAWQAPEGTVQIWTLEGGPPAAGLSPVEGLRLLSNGVEILGWTWLGPLRPGSQGEAWIQWHVAWTDPRESHLFAHLIDGAGVRWAGKDILGYPVAARRPGDWVINRLPMTLADDTPAGPLWLWVGMYTYPEVMPLPVLDEGAMPAADALRLGPVAPTAQGD